MTIHLPPPISAYFQADQGDVVSVADCFADDAVVTDEGNKYIGRDAIRNWKAASSKKYSYTASPFAIGEAGGSIVVTANLVGDFPGSPLDLRYFFILDGDRIVSLEIRL